MFNKNVFTQKDPIADLIKDINEADYKAKMEALKGNQHKIDKNKNNKIDAHDFKILRGEKKVNEEEIEEGWDDMLKAVKAKAGPQPSGGSGMKQGSRYGGSKQKDKPEHDDEKVKKEEIDPKKATTDTLMGRTKGKTGNPFASKKVMMDVPGNVSEEDLDEAGFDAMKHIKNPSPAVKAAAKDVKRGSYADRAALMKAGGVKDDRGPRGVTQEEVEQAEAHSLVENFQMINEVSLGAKIKAYAQHSSDAYEHGDMGNDAEAEHHEKRAEKILAHIQKHHGDEAVGHAEKAANSSIFGRGGHSRGSDSLSGGLRSNRSTAVTKAGKIPKGTQKAMVNQRKTYGSRVAGPKGSLPEEVELDERELSKGETAEKERIVKGMKKSLSGFKARYGDKAKSVMYATATARAKKD
jgi:hypothetical protein